MTGTLAGALEARQIAAYGGSLETEVEGDIEDLDGIMRITNVRIHYRIKIPAGKKEEANRALSVHERGCPAAMTVKGCVDIKWTAELEDD